MLIFRRRHAQLATLFAFLDSHDMDEVPFAWHYSDIMERYDRPTLRRELQVSGVFIR